VADLPQKRKEGKLVTDTEYAENNRILQRMEDNLSQVTEEVRTERKGLRNVWVYGLPAIIVLSFMVPKLVSPMIGLFFVGMLFYSAIGAMKIGAASVGDHIEVSGAEGELRVLGTLRELPNDYIVLNQILVPDSRSSYGHREIDYLVVGPNGAFIIEAKSFKGHVSGGEHGDWRMLKLGRGGTLYTKDGVRNPVQQVKVYIRLLSEALKDNPHRCWLNGIAVLARDNDVSDIDVQSMPVLPISVKCILWKTKRSLAQMSCMFLS
jgi:hypothetical protein